MFSNAAALSPDLIIYTELNSVQPIGLAAEFSCVSGSVFIEAVAGFCEEYPNRCEDIEILGDYNRAECWVRNNGEAGFAIRPGFELVNLFSRQAGCGSEALKFAQMMYQEINLNCYTGKLEDFYGRHGFEVVRHEENWFNTPEKTLPQVVYMSWNKG